MALSGTDASTTIDVVRILVGLLALGIASVTDLSTRKVPNRLWYAAAAVGIGLLIWDLKLIDGSTGWHLLLAFPVAAIFAVTVTGGELWPVMPEDEEDQGRELTPSEARVYVADLVVSGILVAFSIVVIVLAKSEVCGPGCPLPYLIGSIIVIVLALILYLGRLLHGGGDAKALMTLAVLFPIQPLGDTFPLLEVPEAMELAFPFALGVLINAAIITALAPLVFIALSSSRGPLRFPEALFGYPVPIDHVETGNLWLMYEAKEDADQVTRRMWPGRSEEAAAARARALTIMKGQGEDRVYVSPKIPFMVPLFLGLVLAIFLGNIIIGLMSALIGI
jgi:preflagellin peptidase FlaK